MVLYTWVRKNRDQDGHSRLQCYIFFDVVLGMRKFSHSDTMFLGRGGFPSFRATLLILYLFSGLPLSPLIALTLLEHPTVDRPLVILVFFLGGCSYAEISALRFLSQREGGERVSITMERHNFDVTVSVIYIYKGLRIRIALTTNLQFAL